MVDRDTASRFFDTLFGGMPAEYTAVGFMLPSRLSARFRREMGNDFAQWASDKNDNGENIYYGFGIIHEDRMLGAGQRGSREDMGGIVAIGLDIDIDHATAHKKDRLPKTEGEALTILAQFPKPTVIYSSGHGMQAVWCFPDAIIFRNDAHKQEVETFCRSFVYTASGRAKNLGYQIDHTQDITRVFRLPGTINRKIKDSPVPTRIIEWSGLKYDMNALQGYVTSEGHAEATKVVSYSADSITVGSLVLNPLAEPPADKFEALLENDPKFVSLWSRTKLDGDAADGSPSSFDYRMACVVARLKWSDQEICNLMLAARRKHGDNQNIRRNDTYYAPTIAKARRYVEEHATKSDTRRVDAEDTRQRTEELESTIATASTHVTGVATKAIAEKGFVEARDVQLPPELRQEQCKRVSGILGVEISKVWRYVTSPPTYCVVINGCRTRSLSSTEMDSQTKFRQIVAETTNIRFRKLKNSEWDQVSSALFMACEVDDDFGDNDDACFCQELLDTYLRENPPIEGDDQDYAEAIHNSQPIYDNGAVYISLVAFANWRDRKGFPVSPKDLSLTLRSLSAENKQVSKYSKDSGTVRRQMWRLPSVFSNCKRATMARGLTAVGVGGMRYAGGNEQ